MTALPASKWLPILLCGVLAAGCSKPREDFQSYKDLRKSTEPAEQNGPASAGPQANSESADLANAVDHGISPASIDDGIAVAELPVHLLLESRNRIAPPVDSKTSPESSDEVAVAELPEQRKVQLLIPTKEFKRETGALRVSYDDLDLLKVLNMEPVTPDAANLMPSWLKELSGQKIRIRGFMYPPFEETGLSRFVLARDNQICCFGRNPKIYDLITVTMKTDVTTDYIPNRPFDVVGTFHISPAGDSENLDQLYLIDDAVVINR